MSLVYMKCKCLNADFATMTGRGKGGNGLGKETPKVTVHFGAW